MIRGRRVLALIPARSGSKGLPGKNLRPLAGRPLIGWTIDAALAAPSVDRVVVTTDSDEIAMISTGLGAEVPFRRPAALASDDAAAADVVKHAIESLADDADLVAYLQPTSPLRTAADIEACLDIATVSGNRGVASVRTAAEPPEWMFQVGSDGQLQRLLPGALPARRQDTGESYVLNGAIYVVPADAFLSSRRLVDESTMAYVMPADRSVDIDDLADFEAAERLVAGAAEA